MRSLVSLIRDLDMIIASHSLYISRLEKAIKNGEIFDHKAPTECAFGKRFYSEVWPYVDQYPQEIAEVIRKIENVHRQFHEKAYEVEKASTAEEKQEILKATKDISTELFRLLLQLKRLL
ncbi:MAG: CZB domain-containing protein [Aquificaceae bacterium]